MVKVSIWIKINFNNLYFIRLLNRKIGLICSINGGICLIVILGYGCTRLLNYMLRLPGYLNNRNANR
jgi:hypothetical protein